MTTYQHWWQQQQWHGDDSSNGDKDNKDNKSNIEDRNKDNKDNKDNDMMRRVMFDLWNKGLKNNAVGVEK